MIRAWYLRDKLQLLKTFLSSFGFYEMCLKSWYLQVETKNTCLFYMENHIDQVRCVTFVEKVSRWNSISKNIYKKASNLASCGRYQDIIHISKINPKLPKNTMSLNNPN